MPAIINNNALELVGDNLGYQAARVQLPSPPTDADTMIFYYKAYVDKIPADIFSESSPNGWDKAAFFGMSFDNTISTTNNQLVGYSNISNPNTCAYASFRGKYAEWNPNDTTAAFGFDGNWRFRYGNTNSNNYIAGPFSYGAVCPCAGTNSEDLQTAKKYLHIIRINKDVNNAQNISLSLGFNWENLSVDDFGTALTSISSVWAFKDYSISETTSFRTNWNNLSLSGTINFPSWIVAKFPSPTIGRKLVVTDIKIEYYRDEELITQIL